MNQPSYFANAAYIMKHERLLLCAIGAMALIRMAAIIATPLEFGVDEAQYWLWGQEFDFGYYSKPPLIGWYLGAMDMFFGASTIAARLATPLLHSLIALVLYAIGHALSQRVCWQMGGVILGKLANCLTWRLCHFNRYAFACAMGLCACAFLSAEQSGKARDFLLTGLIIGIGLLAKYAAIYFI